jgi:glutamine synthetase
VTLDELRASDVDTVLVAIVDMQGRLQGKRLTKQHFLDEIVPTSTRCGRSRRCAG